MNLNFQNSITYTKIVPPCARLSVTHDVKIQFKRFVLYILILISKISKDINTPKVFEVIASLQKSFLLYVQILFSEMKTKMDNYDGKKKLSYIFLLEFQTQLHELLMLICPGVISINMYLTFSRFVGLLHPPSFSKSLHSIKLPKRTHSVNFPRMPFRLRNRLPKHALLCYLLTLPESNTMILKSQTCSHIILFL